MTIRNAVRRRAPQAALAILIASAVVLTPGTANASQRYAITADGVTVRSGPGTSYGVLGRLNTGDAIDIECQVGRRLRHEDRTSASVRMLRPARRSQIRRAGSGLLQVVGPRSPSNTDRYPNSQPDPP